MGLLGRKRALSSSAEQEEQEEGQGQAKKTRAELMEEIIAKSKLFKVGDIDDTYVYIIM